MKTKCIKKFYVRSYLAFFLVLFFQANICSQEKRSVENVKLTAVTNGEENNFFLRRSSAVSSQKAKRPSFSYIARMAAPIIDLDGIKSGVDYEFQVQPTTSNIYNLATVPNVETDAGVASATITFTGIQDTPNQELFAINDSGFELYYFNTPLDTNTYVIGGSTIEVTQNTATTFSITETSGNPIADTEFETFLTRIFYGDLDPSYTDGVRTMTVSITDTNGDSASAQTIIRVFTSGPTAVDDVHSVMANNTGTISGNVITGAGADSGTSITVSEVDVYASAVGSSYTTLYGSITIQSDGSYVYDVDENSSSITGLRSGESLQDIISYTIIDSSSIIDYGFLTITINGVDEAPDALDNSDSLTAFVDANASGNVITDPDPISGGSDSVDRGLSILVWETEFSTPGGVFIDLSGPVGGTNRTIDGNLLTFTSTDPDGIGIANQNQVVYQTATNGGHTGYLGYAVDPSSNPVASTELIITFSQPVYNLGFLVVDIDFSQSTSWQDQISIAGSLSGTNASFKYVTTGGVVDAGSGTFYGTGSAVPEDATGNVNVFFEEPIDRLVLGYNYGPHATDADLGGQIAGISDIYWQGAASGITVSLIGTDPVTVGSSFVGTYGTLFMNPDGSYQYVPDLTNPLVINLLTGQTLVDTFNYTLSDGSNTDNANLIITINGSGTDTDGDLIPNRVDIDDDNDGILDLEECSSSPVTFSSTTATTGTLNLPNAGGTANWSISNTGQSSIVSSGVSDNDELYFVYDGSGNWTLTSVFEITSIPSGADLQMKLDGFVDKTSSDFSASFGSKFSTYTISWTGGVGDAQVFDPAGNQIIGGGQTISNGGSFTQDTGDKSGGAWSNNLLQWYVIFPEGATQFTINATGGASLEGFRFSAVETFCPDTDMDGIIDSLDLDSDGDGCEDVIESGGTDTTPKDGVLDGNGFNSSGQVTTGGSITDGYDGSNDREKNAVNIDVDTAPSNVSTTISTSSVSFTVVASADQATAYSGGTPTYGTPDNASGGLTYQWYDGDPDSGGVALTNVAPYSNVTTATLGIVPNASLNGKTYFVVIRHPNNTCGEKSSATLCVIDDTLAVSDDTICVGGTGDIIVSNSILGRNYQLRLESNDSNVGAAIAGTGGNITFNVTPSVTTIYNVLVSNGSCSEELTDKSTVTVNADPSITAQPTATQTVCEGGTATVSVTATGGVSLSYQWQSSTTSGGSFSNIASANSASYSAPTTSAGTTYYRVVITDSASGCNSVTSGEAEVIVNADPSITAQPTATQTVCEGGTATVSVTATGGVSLSYQW
ncbi:VCBS domain-containing protein, partial [Tenacibaculum sp. 190130A14a]|uniref:beta strand repeat-containing protein n=2 Tax=Tenacibaculum polynesiense TaxID=3137857 RepID=UPI0032B222CC